MSSTAQNPALLTLIIVGLCLASFFLTSFLSGWFGLARKYRANQSFEGERWNFQSAKFIFVFGYTYLLTIGASAEGLFLSVFFLFRVGHPPLFIPWQDISVRPTKFLWFQMYQFEFRQKPSVKVRLRESLGKKIQAAAGQSWPGDCGATGTAF